MEYMKWQNLIFDETGVNCTCLVKDGIISIRTRDYPDFILAKAALKNKTKLLIIRDVFTT